MSGSREEQLERIRNTYRAYGRSGRDALWDRRNPGYARIAEDHDQALAELLSDALATGRRLLDVGCGRGDLAALLEETELSAELTGIDLLDEVIMEARTRYPQATWVVGSGDALPFPDEAFDVAMVGTLFSSVPGAELRLAMAAEIRRVLTPAGSIIWYDLRYDNPSNPAVRGLSRADVASLFPGWEIKLRSISLLPPLARRLGRLTGVLYPILHAVPLLRSHLIGRLTRS